MKKTALVIALVFIASVSLVKALPAPKVQICHRTGNPNNPFIVIRVSENAFDGNPHNQGRESDHTQHNDFIYLGALDSKGKAVDASWCVQKDQEENINEPEAPDRPTDIIDRIDQNNPQVNESLEATK